MLWGLGGVELGGHALAVAALEHACQQRRGDPAALAVGLDADVLQEVVGARRVVLLDQLADPEPARGVRSRHLSQAPAELLGLLLREGRLPGGAHSAAPEMSAAV